MKGYRPRLLVVLGPNGSGKSSIFSELLTVYTSSGLEFFNPDIVGKVYFSDVSNDIERSKRAILWCGRQQKRCLANRCSFGLETVGASIGSLRIVQRARNADYYIELLFVSTESPEINLRRIAERVERGGHWVEPETVKRRYRQVMERLPEYLFLADEITVVDNSRDGVGRARALLRKDCDGVTITADGQGVGWLQKYLPGYF
ncbi:MAG: zeta toxin family protein [Actinomycetes bacterium]|jgi:predicted ABC-type ATPase|nr:zeta toxin family protein [Actinomycetes bacterium]